MQFHLATGSDSIAYALFDPAALEPFPADAPDDEWPRWFARQSAAGRLLECGPSEDNLELKLLVDEPFEHAAPHERKDVLEGAILRVPTGRLHLRGIEFVRAEDEDDRREEEIDTERNPARANLPAGTYRVTAFRVEYRVPQARRDEEVQAMLQPGDFAYARAVEKGVTPVGCGVVLVATASAAVFVLSASPWTWRFAAIGIAIGVGVFTFTTMMRLMSSPRVARVRDAEAEVDRRYPTKIVILRRLADDEVPETFPPARFGVPEEEEHESTRIHTNRHE